MARAEVTSGTVYVVCKGVIVGSLLVGYNNWVVESGAKTVPTSAREAIAAGADHYYDIDTGQKVYLDSIAGYTNNDRDVEEEVAKWAGESKAQQKEYKKKVKGKQKDDIPERYKGEKPY